MDKGLYSVPNKLKLGLNFWHFLFVERTNQALDSASQ